MLEHMFLKACLHACLQADLYVFISNEYLYNYTHKFVVAYVYLYVLFGSLYLSDALYKYRIIYDPYMANCGQGREIPTQTWTYTTALHLNTI